MFTLKNIDVKVLILLILLINLIFFQWSKGKYRMCLLNTMNLIPILILHKAMKICKLRFKIDLYFICI